jgi:hypothetical protein
MKNRNLWLNLIMAVISLALGVVLSPLLVNLIQNYGFGDTTPLVTILMILMISCILFSVFRSFALKKYDKPMWIMFSVIYIAFMVVALFLKGQGRSVNFDVRHFFDQWNHGSYERAYLIGNCLAFVPYPLLLHFWGIKTKPWRAFLLFVAIEGLQFALSVGAFDVFDLASYIIGYSAGYIVLVLYVKTGVQSAYNIPKSVFSKKRELK